VAGVQCYTRPDQLRLYLQPMSESYGEVWRPIPNFPNYEASDQGRIRSIDRAIVIRGVQCHRRGRVLKPFVTHNGFHQIVMCDKGVTYTRHVHRLVLSAFGIEQPKDKPYACHLNGRDDNSLANLYWGSKEQSRVFAVL